MSLGSSQNRGRRRRRRSRRRRNREVSLPSTFMSHGRSAYLQTTPIVQNILANIGQELELGVLRGLN